MTTQSIVERNALAIRLRHRGCEDCLMAAFKPGQEWEDLDMRPAGRRVRIVSVHPKVIYNPAYARVVNVETGRESGIQLYRLLRGFKFVGMRS